MAHQPCQVRSHGGISVATSSDNDSITKVATKPPSARRPLEFLYDLRVCSAVQLSLRCDNMCREIALPEITQYNR